MSKWHNGEITRLPPMWPGFKSQHGCHMWVEFVVGSLLCSKGFFFRCTLQFSPLLKNQYCQITIRPRIRPLTKPGSDCSDRIGLWIGSDSGSDRIGSDRIGLRIGSDWQFALNSRQNGHVTSPGMKMAERKVCIQSSVTNLVFLFFFLL